MNNQTQVETTAPAAAPQPTVARKKLTCALEDCKDKPVKIVGDCRWCSKRFCSRHRLPEAHACVNLSGCRENSTEKFASRLLAEKT
ncbi:MAG: hypothetical protein SGCHY_005541, partial [Lobulomycetales sp.]